MRPLLSTQQQGIGLIEVVVSLLLLAVAVLGYSALQGQALKATDESLERSQSLVMMRNMGEKVRANPSAIAIYQEKLNETTLSEPTNKCGLDGGAVSSTCDPTQLANADVYYFKKELSNYGFDIKMYGCPNTGGNSPSNIMYSYCLLVAWGDTTPTIGSDDKEDCLTDGGIYHPKATCMMMEL